MRRWIYSLNSTDAGLSKLCQDLGVDPADIVMLIISFYCEVSSLAAAEQGLLQCYIWACHSCMSRSSQLQDTAALRH